jgi:hypothetical protein
VAEARERARADNQAAKKKKKAEAKKLAKVAALTADEVLGAQANRDQDPKRGEETQDS